MSRSNSTTVGGYVEDHILCRSTISTIEHTSNITRLRVSGSMLAGARVKAGSLDWLRNYTLVQMYCKLGICVYAKVACSARSISSKASQLRIESECEAETQEPQVCIWAPGLHL